MIGICIELKTSCTHCSQALMLNAFTEDILCPNCNKTNTFDSETWGGLLDDAMNEAPRFQPGEGQPSTIMRGGYTYSLMYGRQEPRCGKCKQGVDAAKLEEYSTKGNIECTKCANPIFIRKPSELVANNFSTVKFLIGEDDDLLSVNKSDGTLPAAAKPVVFTCPSCAGGLRVDGTSRMIDCQFCDSQVYLPDDLWFRLHPPKIVERWYMMVEPEAKKKKKVKDAQGVVTEVPEIDLPEWYYISDSVCDKHGNLYFATHVDYGGDFKLWSVTHDLKPRWERNDLKLSQEKVGIAITHDGHLYVWDQNKHSLLKISSKDGSTIKKIEGDQNRDRLNMKGCTSLISCPDGTILTIIHNSFARFRENGERVKLWNANKWGLFPSGKGNRINENDSEWAPYLKDVGSVPKRISGDFTKMIVGYDGYIYMIDRSSSDGEIAKYDMDGRQLWSKYIPLNNKDCKPAVDQHSNVYVIGTDDNSMSRLKRYNAKAARFDTILKDVLEKSFLNGEDQLVVAPNGTVYAIRYYNRLKVFSPDMKMTFRSKESEKEDDEKVKKKQDAIANDEEFG